jgi:hypothetical protein
VTDWENIHKDFTEELQKRWEEKEFEYEEVKKWIDAGLTVNDVQFAIYLKKKEINIEHLNKNNIEVLKKKWLGNQYKKLCEPCQIGNCEKFLNCANPWICICVCGVNSVCDITEKIGIVLFGGASTVGGFALPMQFPTPYTPILGGAMVGAGINSVTYGVEKAFSQERIDWKDYLIDTTVSAGAGAISGATFIGGERIIAKKAIESFARKLGVRVGAGAVSGLAIKGCDEFRHYFKGEKKWSDLGKSFDENNEFSGWETTKSWTSSAVMGGLGGAFYHFSSGLSEHVVKKASNFSWVESVAKASIETGASGIIDFGFQEANVWSGKQEKIDWDGVVRTMVITAGAVVAREGTKEAVYWYNGEKGRFFDKLRVKKTPKKGYQEPLMEAPDMTNHPKNRTFLERQKEVTEKYKALKLKVSQIEKKLQGSEICKNEERVQLETEFFDKKNELAELKLLTKQKSEWGNAHLIKGGEKIAIDVCLDGKRAKEGGSRGPARLISNYNEWGRHDVEGFTENHDYSNITKFDKVLPPYIIKDNLFCVISQKRNSLKPFLEKLENKRKEWKKLSDNLNIKENQLSELHEFRERHQSSQESNSDREKIDKTWNDLLSFERTLTSEKGIERKNLDKIYNLYLEAMKLEEEKDQALEALIETVPSRNFVILP